MGKHLSISILLLLFSLVGKSQYNSNLIIEKLLQTDTNSIGQKIVYPNFSDSEITMSKITIPPGKSTGWHKHSIPVLTYILKGTLTVELGDHRVFKFKENTSFAESINTYHNGTNMEDSDLVVIAIYLGAKGQKLSIMKE
jgi:quercetin dioxygenase-like cupin family protein